MQRCCQKHVPHHFLRFKRHSRVASAKKNKTFRTKTVPACVYMYIYIYISYKYCSMLHYETKYAIYMRLSHLLPLYTMVRSSWKINGYPIWETLIPISFLQLWLLDVAVADSCLCLQVTVAVGCQGGDKELDQRDKALWKNLATLERQLSQTFFQKA